MITNRPAFDREQLVFNDQSLAKALRDVRMSWHFHHIFEFTIRFDPQHRYDNTARALDGARDVRRLICDEYKPLEQLADCLCPMCGVGIYGQSIGLVTYYADEMAAFWQTHVAPLRLLFRVSLLFPRCFHSNGRTTKSISRQEKARLSFLPILGVAPRRSTRPASRYGLAVHAVSPICSLTEA
jgi:hypothetical protein